MKNNRLTAKYIKDVFRFMEMYNINQVIVNNINFVIEHNTYNIISDKCNKREWHDGDTIQELLESFKQSIHYMMKLED